LTTKNYTQLQDLYKKYKDEGFEVLAFPCNQFGGQEPNDLPEILQFVKTSFQVSFPLFAKVEVNGKHAIPLFRYLKNTLTGTLGKRVKWNFTKFLCDREGKPIRRFGPPTAPIEMEQDIKALLQQGK